MTGKSGARVVDCQTRRQFAFEMATDLSVIRRALHSPYPALADKSISIADVRTEDLALALEAAVTGLN
jgi:hypothetical protein